MKFETKLKIRLYTAITIFILGVVFIVIGFMKPVDTLSSFGVMFAIIGMARIRQYVRITKNADALHERKIIETDERNIAIWTKSRSLAASVYVIVSAIVIITLYILDMKDIATVISYTIIVFTLINWICYYVISGNTKIERDIEQTWINRLSVTEMDGYCFM